MSEFRAWLRWMRDVRRLRRETELARLRWLRAYYAYQDIAVVYRDQPGAMFAGPVGEAQDESWALMNEFKALQAQLDRLEQVGP